MTWTVDARVPVRFGRAEDAGEGDALLIEGAGPAPAGFAAGRFEAGVAGHAPGCACCAPRNGAALALDRLFQARARGTVPFFRRVLAVTSGADGDMAVWTALRTDPLTSGRFRAEREPPA